LRDSNIPAAYLPTKIDPGAIIYQQNPELREYIKNLIEEVNNGHGLYLYSTTTGNGKTTLACNLLLKYLFRESYRLLKTDILTPVMYLNVVEFLETLRREMTKSSEDTAYLLSQLFDKDAAPRLLLLDDIGAEKPSDWVRERLYSLINFRSANKLATIYTSNCPPESLVSMVGQRCYSRIIGDNMIVEMRGKDHRIGG
jgi:DNA replication protein DnaC